jgi:hypothetical protein
MRRSKIKLFNEPAKVCLRRTIKLQKGLLSATANRVLPQAKTLYLVMLLHPLTTVTPSFNQSDKLPIS